MQVRVLGRVEVCGDDGAAVVIGQRKLRQLVAVLALADGPVSSGRLQSMLWAENRNAVSALTTTLNRLRRVVPDGRLVREEGGYCLVVNRGRDYLDVWEFRELVTTARAVRGAYPARSAELLQRAIELWRDPELPDLADVPALVDELGFERQLDLHQSIDRITPLKTNLLSHHPRVRQIRQLRVAPQLNSPLQQLR